MGKYCCFLCPGKDYSEKTLDALCPTCGRPYGFPLTQRPDTIREYRVLESRDRGFYASTYLCTRGRLDKKYILKVSPELVYKYFTKNFAEECSIHRDVAEGTEHIVPINDFFDLPIVFGDQTIECHVAVIDFVDGPSLRQFLEKPGSLNVRSVAQIAIDLFRIRREFVNKLKYHNDLDADNIIIQLLSEDTRRAESIDDLIRAVAIDLGSDSDDSKSDACDGRLGDQHWLASHLQLMVGKLREARAEIDSMDDLDIRLSETLERIVNVLLPPVTSARSPSADNLMRIVRDEFFRVNTYSPWKTPLNEILPKNWTGV